MSSPQSPLDHPSAPPALGNVFLESRYRKLVRGLPQTTFFCPKCQGRRRRRKRCEHCDGQGRLFEDSVQDLLGRVLLPAFKARSGKFHGAGREDLDVRMLGSGRPFVFEIVGPRRIDVDLAGLVTSFERQHGARVQIDALCEVSKARVAELKSAKFAKLYRAEVEFDAAVLVSRLLELVAKPQHIVQRTPRRVAHRRSDLERSRTVELVAVGGLAAGLALTTVCSLDLRCEHGTYVKEWISGDEQRTTPSLASWVGVGATCRALDVLEILDRPIERSSGA